MTPEEIEAQIRTDHPEFRVSEDGEVTVISPETAPEEYEAMLMERVQWQIEAQEQQEAQDAWQATITQFTNGLDTLEADLAFIDAAISGSTNLTQAQIKTGFRDVLRSIIWLAERIEDGTIPVRKPPGDGSETP